MCKTPTAESSSRDIRGEQSVFTAVGQFVEQKNSGVHMCMAPYILVTKAQSMTLFTPPPGKNRNQQQRHSYQ